MENGECVKQTTNPTKEQKQGVLYGGQSAVRKPFGGCIYNMKIPCVLLFGEY